MSELQRHDRAVADQGASETGPETEEEHRGPAVAPQRLHRRVVDDLHRAAEGGAKVEPDPSLCQVVRLGGRPILADQARVADRYDVVLPALGQLLHALNHLQWCHLLPGRKPPSLRLTGCEDLDARAADVDDENLQRYFH